MKENLQRLHYIIMYWPKLEFMFSLFFSSYLNKDRYEFQLKGIEIMNDDPSEVDVLYANVVMKNQDDYNDFQEVVDKISNLFHISGMYLSTNSIYI